MCLQALVNLAKVDVSWYYMPLVQGLGNFKTLYGNSLKQQHICHKLELYLL